MVRQHRANRFINGRPKKLTSHRWYGTAVHWLQAVLCSPAAGCVAPPPCIYSDLVLGWHIANEIAKTQVCINSNNSSCDCDKLQPEMEICNRKQKLTSTRVVKNYSSSLLLEYSRQPYLLSDAASAATISLVAFNCNLTLTVNTITSQVYVNTSTTSRDSTKRCHWLQHFCLVNIFQHV